MFPASRSTFLMIVLSFFLAAGCTTKVTGTWKKSDYAGQPMRSILVVGLTGDPTNRLLWEDIMREQLRQAGIEAVASLSAFPDDREIDEEEIIKYVTERGMDGVLVTRLLDTHEKKIYHTSPGAGYPWVGTYSYYGNLGAYYSRSLMMSQAEGYYTSQTVYILETNLYQVKSQELVWNMTSDTFDPNSPHTIVKSVSKKVLSQLKKDGLI